MRRREGSNTLQAKTCEPRVLLGGVGLLGEVRKKLKEKNVDYVKIYCIKISWAKNVGYLVTSKQVHALLCSHVHVRALQAFAKFLKNGPPTSGVEENGLF